ncbi:MAG: hypothetical protein DRO98_03535 [Archaeoglobales archaeon]|nr:MAG: hypothetical protein DRO98_03535 [Archaeoglobales archaeon]
MEVTLECERGKSFIILQSDTSEVVIKRHSTWSESHIAVAGRYGLLLAYQAIPEMIESAARKEASPEEKEVATKILCGFSAFIDVILKSPYLAPLPVFVTELLEASGIKYKPELREVGIGLYKFTPIIFTPSTVLRYRDMINKELELPARQAPSGVVDYSLIDLIVSKSANGSLIIVEEPEEHKNPLQQIELMRRMVNLSKEKNLTLVLTTHSEIVIHAILKEVETGSLKNDAVKLYYFKRDDENPWTTVEEIGVHKDGSLEEPLLDFEEAVVQIF